MIEREITITNARKFLTFLLARKCSSEIKQSIMLLVNAITGCSEDKVATLTLGMSESDFTNLINYLESINKDEIKVATKNTRGEWELLLDELNDTFNIPF